MFAGHVGAGLAIGRMERRLNPGLVVLAALLLDVVLWILVLGGVERATIPADYAARRYLLFDFPVSHGMVLAAGWALAAAGAAALVARGGSVRPGRAAAVVGLAVASHELLDLLVHVPEIPLLGRSSPALGLGLWRVMPVALAAETAIAFGGLAWYLRGSDLPTGRRIGLVAVVAVVTALTVAGQTVAPAPPDVGTVAGSGLVSIAATVALVGWLGRTRSAGR